MSNTVYRYIALMTFILGVSFGCDSGGDHRFFEVNLGDEAFYSFDETEGAVTDNSSSTLLDGNIVGARRELGKVNNALYFGLNLPSYVEFEVHDEVLRRGIKIDFPLNEVSVEAWIKLESLDTNKTYSFFTSDSFRIDVVSNQVVVTLTSGSAFELIRTDEVFGVDTWYHFSFTYDGSSAKIFINGELNNQSSIVTTLESSVNTLYLGGIGGYRSSGNTESFPGYIDEFRFSQQLRTAQEISDYYNLTN